MKKYVLVLVILLSFSFHSPVLASNDSTITINGKFLGNSEKYGQKFRLLYYENYLGALSPSIGYETVIKNGAFKISIRNKKKFAYIAMMYGVDDDSNVVRTKSAEFLRANVYLFSSGTVVTLNISDNNAVFKGKGAEQLNCQYELYKAGQRPNLPIFKNKDSYGRLLSYKSQLDSLFTNQIEILLRYQSLIGLPVFNILKTDFESDVKLSCIRMPLCVYSDNLEQMERNKAQFRFYSDQFLFTKNDTTASEAELVSRSYGEFLLRKLVHNLDISMLASSKTVRLSFDQIYDQINQVYKGALRDRLLAGCFLDYFQKHEAPNWYLDDVVSKVTTPGYYNFLEDFRNRLGSGKLAYNFSLPDSSGKVYTQEMLKGKLVILDFWFTGCGGCQLLNEKMKPVYEYYKDNPEVKFVTVSIDGSLKIFKSGLNEGVYTHPGSLNLYTAGLKEDHSIIEHYKVISYPTIIVIGKDGKIITSSPPLPYTEEASLRFIKMINNNIKM